MTLILLVCSLIFQLILSFLVYPKTQKSYLIYTGYVLYSIFILSFIKTVFTNPGIPGREMMLTQEIRSQIRNSQTNNSILTCNTCGLCVPQTTKIGHCLSCKICIIGYDHHCGWSSKCIGEGNIIEFRIFLYSGLIFLIYGIFSAIYIPISTE